MIKRNPEREARLLEEWRIGTSAREAAAKTGIPEGTVHYYWRKFNKDPEKANRLASSLKPNKKLGPIDVLVQVNDIRAADEIDAKYRDLTMRGQDAQAKFLIEAEMARRRYRATQLSSVNSPTACYLANPATHEFLLPAVAAEAVLGELQAGIPFLDAVARVRANFLTISKQMVPGHVDLMMAVLQELENRHASLK